MTTITTAATGCTRGPAGPGRLFSSFLPSGPVVSRTLASWMSLSASSGRKGYWLRYYLPALLVVYVTEGTEPPSPFREICVALALALAAIGAVRRLRDLGMSPMVLLAVLPGGYARRCRPPAPVGWWVRWRRPHGSPPGSPFI